MTRLGQRENQLSDVSGVRIAEALKTNSTVTQLSLVTAMLFFLVLCTRDAVGAGLE